MWFGAAKVESQERHSPKIEGAFKVHLDKWLAARPSRGNREALLFPSTVHDGQAVDDGTVRTVLQSLRKKAGITKETNPHAFRHARVTWGIINKEDTAILSVGIWGKPVSSMMKTYSAFSGLDMKLGNPVARELPDVPALPVPPVLSTQKQVAELMTEMERMRETQRKQLEFFEWALNNPEVAKSFRERKVESP